MREPSTPHAGQEATGKQYMAVQSSDSQPLDVLHSRARHSTEHLTQARSVLLKPRGALEGLHSQSSLRGPRAGEPAPRMRPRWWEQRGLGRLLAPSSAHTDNGFSAHLGARISSHRCSGLCHPTPAFSKTSQLANLRIRRNHSAL